MSWPATDDWKIWIGNDLEREFCIEGLNLTGSVIVVTFTWNAGSLVLRSDGTSPPVTFLAQPLEGVFGWFRVAQTAVQTRDLPLNAAITYEIEHRAGGKETTYLTGRVITATGGNIDG